MSAGAAGYEEAERPEENDGLRVLTNRGMKCFEKHTAYVVSAVISGARPLSGG